MKCEASPIWGSDVIIAVTTTARSRATVADEQHTCEESIQDVPWARPGESHLQCLRASEPLKGRRNYESLWSETSTIRRMLHTPEQYIEELKDIIQRYIISLCVVSTLLDLTLIM